MTASTNEAARGLRVMLVGSFPPPVGGTTVSLEQLRAFLDSRVARCVVVDCNPRGRSAGRAALRALWQVLLHARACDVVTLHFSDRAGITAGPMLWVACRLLGRPTVYRQFGGQFAATYAALPRWWQTLVGHTILASQVVLLQTKSMVSTFDRGDGRVRWFPTARASTPARYAGRFASGEAGPLRCMFVGHVRRKKGVLDAVAAIGRVPGATLDVYGPLFDVTEAELAAPRVAYRGPVEPEQVTTLMAQHDLLLFPSFYPGEGYPGTLVEAAMVGLPMVLTRWQSLPEMFGPEEAWFVDPCAPEALAAVIRDVVERPASLARRSEALRRRASDFDAESVFGRFVQTCVQVAGLAGTAKEA